MAQIPNADNKDSLIRILRLKIKTLLRQLSLLRTKLQVRLASHQKTSWLHRPLSCYPNLNFRAFLPPWPHASRVRLQPSQPTVVQYLQVPIVLGMGTIIPQMRVGWDVWVGYNHLISNKHEWNNCFIKNTHKISRILPDFICKNNRFLACF